MRVRGAILKDTMLSKFLQVIVKAVVFCYIQVYILFEFFNFRHAPHSIYTDFSLQFLSNMKSFAKVHVHL